MRRSSQNLRLMSAHPSSRASAELRYNDLRRAVPALVETSFAHAVAPTPVHLGMITTAVLAAWTGQWVGHPGPGLGMALGGHQSGDAMLAGYDGPEISGPPECLTGSRRRR